MSPAIRLRGIEMSLSPLKLHNDTEEFDCGDNRAWSEKTLNQKIYTQKRELRRMFNQISQFENPKDRPILEYLDVFNTMLDALLKA